MFANVVLADEINRASPKTQAALLEVMEERHVTVDGVGYDVPRPFVVLATQNPVEQEGTYRLPEAQLDRFLMRTTLGYPDHDHEVDVLRMLADGLRPEGLSPVMSTSDVRNMIEVAEHVHVEDSIRSYVVRLCAATRTLPELRLGVSTRGAIGLIRTSRALAAAQARPFVTADDVRIVAPAVMGHRMLLTPEAELGKVDPGELVEQVIDRVDLPAAMRGRVEVDVLKLLRRLPLTASGWTVARPRCRRVRRRVAARLGRADGRRRRLPDRAPRRDPVRRRPPHPRRRADPRPGAGHGRRPRRRRHARHQPPPHPGRVAHDRGARRRAPAAPRHPPARRRPHHRSGVPAAHGPARASSPSGRR